MPKRTSDFLASDANDVDDTSSTQAIKPSKKPKTASATTTSSSTPSTAPAKDSNGDPYWPLNASDSRRVTLNTFRGKTMVNIREYYEKDGTLLPGKKGISLVIEQWAALVSLLPQLEGALREMGESVPRPVFGDCGNGDGMETEQGQQAGEGATRAQSKGRKPNHEDTSDEDDVAGNTRSGSG